MKTLDDVNLYEWFLERELSFVPEHFVVSETVLTTESKLWIKEKLIGRYAIFTKHTGYYNANGYPAFEDPKEAMFYELKWA
jgi:transposase